jgi:hypothetical protein
MSYSDFDLRKVKTTFGLTLIENESLFANVPELKISAFLAETLAQTVPLALAIGTEKASSELIIVNLFLELKRLGKMSFFSGIEFNVDKEQGLNGFCDFIISNSSEQFFLESPVVFIAEAKNEKINNGLGQCIAEMVAAQLYNERENQPKTCIYGAVTTGHVWKFLKYENPCVYIDSNDFYIDRPDKIMGILAAMIRYEC